MIIASRPADLFPATTFWYLMAHADLFDLRIFDRLHVVGPQRRVMMRGRWASVPIIGGPPGALVSDARIVPGETQLALTELVTERYQGARHWDRVGPAVLDMINQTRTEMLWQFNLQLILGIRELLDIRTPVSIGRPPVGDGDGDRLASVVAAYNATTYLTEAAGRAYADGDESYQVDGLTIAWSTHRPVTGDSILSVLMDYDDPMTVVLAEQARPTPRRVSAGVRA